MRTRRETIAMLVATAAMAGTRVSAAPRALPCPVTRPLDDVADRLLAHLPETATYNGAPQALDGGPLARRMDDYSPAGEAAWRAELARAGAELGRLSCTGDRRGALRLATARAVVANGTRSAAVPYGRVNPFWYSGHLPYIVNQIGGPAVDTVNFMAAQQSLSTPAAVDAWITKLDGFRQGFAGVIEKMKADEAAGCRPPKPILAATLPMLDAFLAGDAASHPLIVALRTRMADAALDGRARRTAEARAITALERHARPAIAELRAHVALALPRGREDDGVWAQTDGEALYAANVRALGDTVESPAEIHRIGLAEVARIGARLNVLLRQRGLSRGSVGARLTALGRDPRQLFPDSDAGREAALDYARALIRGVERRQREFLPAAMIPRQALEVRRVPVASEAGAPGAYADPPSLDGSRPGVFWLNLRDMRAVPRMAIATTTYHEAVPGHHTQGAVALGAGEAPLLIRVASFNAYAEGWALYAEQLADELGLYKGDPAGNIGRLQAELFRAARLVVDTGLHHHRWSRDKAVAYLAAVTGQARGEVVAEVHRYMAWPGQALGYTLGHLRLRRMRADMARRLGRRFDRRRFHAAVLGEGPMPLDLVETLVAAG
ncbi:MAG: hypothetical protein JWM75_1043 [Sphingomonas bacterium]|nr:hypothetical protein [Sphingomonas bacterium]